MVWVRCTGCNSYNSCCCVESRMQKLKRRESGSNQPPSSHPHNPTTPPHPSPNPPSQKVRNERAIDALMSELDDLEDEMREMVGAAMKGRTAAKVGGWGLGLGLAGCECRDVL